ncbi:MAG: glycosyltransferase family 2 protein [Nitrospirae bacterium]|nr:MAG: glycosyltransferase family 2 protein [Nitrospirota bacterium]
MTLSQSDPPHLSIVIPAYNEAGRILPYLTSITAYFKQRSISHETLVIDDGSRDATATIVEQFQADEPNVRLLRLPVNRGKGYAVRTGMRQARGTLRLFADADGATPIQELERLEAGIAQGADIAIGSRFLASRDSRYTVKARWHRSTLGNIFNWMIQRSGVRGITDTQCGFKLFKGAVADDLFSVACIDGYGFDLELLYIAQHRGYKIAEVPINWSDQPGSKVWVLKDGFCMLREMLAIRRNDAQGLYARQPTNPSK